MSNDERFDGKLIYHYMRGGQAFDIRGKYIYRANSTGGPEYEIRGSRIYRSNNASQPVFQIRGTILLPYGKSVPLYEIR